MLAGRKTLATQNNSMFMDLQERSAK